MISALRDLYGRNGAETISGLCGTRVVLAAPDKDTAQWSADSLGRSEVEEVAEGFSYGVNTIRDGVSLTPRRELRALALPSEIMRLPPLHGYLRFPGPLPAASIALDYVSRPKAAERFVPRKQAPEPEPPERNAGPLEPPGFMAIGTAGPQEDAVAGPPPKSEAASEPAPDGKSPGSENEAVPPEPLWLADAESWVPQDDPAAKRNSPVQPQQSRKPYRDKKRGGGKREAGKAGRDKEGKTERGEAEPDEEFY